MAEERTITPEAVKVRDWRFDQLTSLGLDHVRAGVAASDTNFEIEQFRSLRQADCAPTTAYEIVR